MKNFYGMLSGALATLALAAPLEEGSVEKRATPKIWLAGDSTMALGGGGALTQGWGVYLPYSITGATVVNDAVGGTSARSFTTSGRFNTIINSVSAGDWVVIEFGHNDGGSLSPTDNGRSDCPGSGAQTCKTSAGLVVQTYVTYLTNAAKSMIAKGAKVIISSNTPDNVCESGTCSYAPSRFVAYCKQVVANVGAGATFIDHGLYVGDEYIALGAKTVNSYYPKDHTHTSPIGANVVAGQFVKAVLCANNPLAAHIKNSTASVQGSCH